MFSDTSFRSVSRKMTRYRARTLMVFFFFYLKKDGEENGLRRRVHGQRTLNYFLLRVRFRQNKQNNSERAIHKINKKLLSIF